MNAQFKFNILCTALISFFLVVSSCTNNHQEEMENLNILLEEWEGPYGGVPAFDKMNLSDVKPAMEKGMELNLAEIDEIANSSLPPTFENTIEAM